MDQQCRRCKGAVQSGLKCINCGIVSHKSCLKIMKNVQFIDDKTVSCCDGGPEDVKRKGDSGAGINCDDPDKIRIKYLEELNKQKDLVIANQAIAIKSLQEQVELLKRNPLNNKVPRKSIIQDTEKYQFNTTNPVEVNAPSVSGALHQATASSICRNIINLNDDINNTNLNQNKEEKKPLYQSKYKTRPTRKLVIGNSKNTSVNLIKAIQTTKAFHVSKLDPKTTETQLEDFLKQLVVEPRVEAIKSKYPEIYSSFKITIKEADVPSILNPSNWPDGVIVNRFFLPRPKNTSGTEQA